MNRREISEFMPDIYRKLEWLSKEDLIKRMVLTNLTALPNITATAQKQKYRPIAVANVPEEVTEKKVVSKKEAGKLLRASTVYSLTQAKRDSFFPSDLIGLLNSNTRGRIELGRIDLMQNFSFFEVPEKEAINVVKALSRAKWNGRKVVVEVSSEEGGKGHENGSSERKGGKRFG